MPVGFGLGIAEDGFGAGAPLVTYEGAGTLVSMWTADAYTGTTLSVEATPELAGVDAIPNLWENDTESNRPAVLEANVNSLDVYAFGTNDGFHIQSPEQFASPGPSPMDIAGPFTAFCSFRLASIAGNFEFMTEDFGGSESTFWVGTGGNIHWWDGAQTDLATNGDVSVDTWYVICVRRDASDNLYVYLNGTEITTGTPIETADFTPQMIKAGTNDSRVRRWLVYSNDINIININTIGQTMTDEIGLADTWSLT